MSSEAADAALEKMRHQQERQREERLSNRIEEYRLDDRAREALKRERSAALLRLPPPRGSYTLRSYLDEDKPPKLERIAGFQRVGQNAALIAAYKTGKTTLTANLAKALADGTKFLGEFDVTAPSGRVGFWNAEMDGDEIEQYLTEAGIENADDVVLWNLRGFRLDLLSETGREAAVEWLKGNDVSYWIIDPWARLCAWSNVSENDNGEVSELLQRVSEVAADAGVAERLIVHHQGLVQGRARGATVFSDDPDVLWQYDRDDDARLLHIFGRGIEDKRGMVELDNGATVWNPISRKKHKLQTAMKMAVDYVRENPGSKRGEIYDALEIAASDKKAVVDEALRTGHLTDTAPDGRTSALYVLDSEGLAL